ncbi:MAG: PLP-dependent aminotransferase family protein [Propionibacteriaceae bacterium]
MSFEFPVSHRFDNVSSSPTRDILAVLSRGDIISFAGGIPDPALFPVQKLAEASAWVYENRASRALQYSATPGEPELRAQAAKRVSRWLPTDASQIQITSGSQEAIFLVAMTICDEGDVILMEQPTYLAAVQSFSLLNCTLVAVPSDDNGVIPEELDRLIKEHNPKATYLIPTFQNPSGRCMSAERRQAVADVIIANDSTLIEDDPYGEIRFDGEAIAPISSLPGMSARSLYINSISKVVSPGLRVGWIRGEGEIMKQIEVCKQGSSLQGSVIDQLTVARFLETVDLDEHITKIIEAYRGRRDAMAQCLAELVPSAQITAPIGGMFFWAKFPDHIDTAKLNKYAIDEGVAFVPGFPFYAETPDNTTMRISYVTNSPEVIQEGVTRLARAIAKYEADLKI